VKKHQMLIGGKWVNPASGEWFESVNPFTAKPWALVPRGSKADVDELRISRRMAEAERNRARGAAPQVWRTGGG
jgi:acyl-CoA reductase-like NAD-dependent aldehyde dehydrogenase